MNYLFKRIYIASIFLIVVLALMASSFAGGYYYHLHKSIIPAPKASSKYNLIDEAISEIQATYYQKVNSTTLINGAIKGMMDSLGDKYASYMPPKKYDKFSEHMSGNYSGIGLYIGGEKGNIVAMGTIDGTPAKTAGLKEGDKILEVDGKSVNSLSVDDVVKRIRGQAGTKVKLIVSRKGKKHVYDLTRKKIDTPNVFSKKIGNIGYIKAHSFTKTISEKMKEKLTIFKKDKSIKGIILDLRANPGGELDQAIDVVGLFLTNVVAVRTKSRTQGNDSLFTTGQAVYNGPLVVLVDGNSASASEIVAGALKDHKRAKIVGQKTFGKGSVQTVVSLKNNGALLVPSQNWYTPSWRSINKVGIEPDFKVKLTIEDEKDTQLEKAKELLSAN